MTRRYDVALRLAHLLGARGEAVACLERSGCSNPLCQEALTVLITEPDAGERGGPARTPTEANDGSGYIPVQVIDGGPLGALTTRERAVVVGAAQGKSNAQVAKEQQVTVDTVKYQLRTAFKKLGVAHRIDLVPIVFGNDENDTVQVAELDYFDVLARAEHAARELEVITSAIRRVVEH